MLELFLEYRKRVKTIRQQQTCSEFYTKIFSRHFSYQITAFLSFLPVTPNQLTLFMFPLGILAGMFFSFGTIQSMLIGGIFTILLNLFDTIDGELARFQKKSSVHGDYLDRLAHYVTNTVIIIGFGYGLGQYFKDDFILAIGIFSAIIVIFDDASRDLLVTCGLQKLAKERKEKKKVTKIKAPKAILILGQLIGSNTALFHLIPFWALMSLLFDIHLSGEGLIMKILMFYLFLFFAINILKLLLRILKIRHEFFL